MQAGRCRGKGAETGNRHGQPEPRQMNDQPVAAATRSDSESAASVAQGFGQAGAAAQLAVKRDHQRHHGDVVHRHDARHDPGRAQRDQRAGQPEQLVGPGRRDHAGIAARQHQLAWSPAQPLQVVDRQRAVIEAKRGEQRAVGAKGTVGRDVHQPGAVDRTQDPRRGRGAVAKHDGFAVDGVVSGELRVPRLPGKPSRDRGSAPPGRPRCPGGHRRRLAGHEAKTSPRARRSLPGSAGAAATPMARRAAGRPVRRSHRHPPDAHRPRREERARASRPSWSAGREPARETARMARRPGASARTWRI